MSTKLAELLEHHLTSSELSAYELAKRMTALGERTAESTISRIRAGKVGTSYQKAQVMAKVFGVDEVEFLAAAGFVKTEEPVSQSFSTSPLDNEIYRLALKLNLATTDNLEGKSERYKQGLIIFYRQWLKDIEEGVEGPDLEEEVQRRMPHNKPPQGPGEIKQMPPSKPRGRKKGNGEA